MSTNNSTEILVYVWTTGFKPKEVVGREQESTRVEQAKTIAKESALEVEEEEDGKILAKKVTK